MPKRAVSVTLDRDNLAWLKARASATGARSLSALLDEIVGKSRQAGVGPTRSVVGTIDVHPQDPDLEGADGVVRALFEASLARPLVVRERAPARRARRATKRRHG
jgi:hypothetical protein